MFFTVGFSLETLNVPFRELYQSFTHVIMTQKLTAAKYNNNKINKQNQCRLLAGEIIKSSGRPHHLSIIPLKNFYLFKIVE